MSRFIAPSESSLGVDGCRDRDTRRRDGAVFRGLMELGGGVIGGTHSKIYCIIICVYQSPRAVKMTRKRTRKHLLR